MTNARIEQSSILAFACAFTLTSGRNARYSEAALTHSIINLIPPYNFDGFQIKMHRVICDNFHSNASLFFENFPLHFQVKW